MCSLARAISQGRLVRLEELGLAHNEMETSEGLESGGPNLMRAIAQGKAFHDLVSFHLWSSAFRGGFCRFSTYRDSNASSDITNGYMHLTNGVAAGSLPALRRLDLSFTTRMTPTLESLAVAIANQGLPQLQEVRHRLSSKKTHFLPLLIIFYFLYLSFTTRMTPTHESLAVAIANQGLPRLQEVRRRLDSEMRVFFAVDRERRPDVHWPTWLPIHAWYGHREKRPIFRVAASRVWPWDSM
jgi:hypothetical protein